MGGAICVCERPRPPKQTHRKWQGQNMEVEFPWLHFVLYLFLFSCLFNETDTMMQICWHAVNLISSDWMTCCIAVPLTTLALCYRNSKILKKTTFST